VLRLDMRLATQFLLPSAARMESIILTRVRAHTLFAAPIMRIVSRLLGARLRELSPRFYGSALCALLVGVAAVGLAVTAEMFSLASEKHQVRQGVVSGVSVAMVDRLPGGEWSSKMLLHDVAVFEDVLAVNVDRPIPIAVVTPFTLPTRMVSTPNNTRTAGVATEARLPVARVERLPARFTDVGDALDSSFAHTTRIAELALCVKRIENESISLIHGEGAGFALPLTPYGDAIWRLT